MGEQGKAKRSGKGEQAKRGGKSEAKTAREKPKEGCRTGADATGGQATEPESVLAVANGSADGEDSASSNEIGAYDETCLFADSDARARVHERARVRARCEGGMESDGIAAETTVDDDSALSFDRPDSVVGDVTGQKASLFDSSPGLESGPEHADSAPAPSVSELLAQARRAIRSLEALVEPSDRPSFVEDAFLSVQLGIDDLEHALNSEGIAPCGLANDSAAQAPSSDMASDDGSTLPPKRRSLSNKELGRKGERAAALFLERRGYEVVERNWRCPAGEADIIARDEDGTVVFVEVKTRSGVEFGFPSESVTPARRRRYERIAGYYLSDHVFRDARVRFDVVAILAMEQAKGGPRAYIRHHANAFGIDE